MVHFLLYLERGFGAIINFSDQALFPDNNYVDWSQFGPPFSGVASGSVATAAFFGTTVTVSTDTSTPMLRRNQGAGWNGNFAPGDALIHSQLDNDRIILDFSRDIWGGGAQFQRNNVGSFTGTLEAYDAGLNLLGSFNLAGNSHSGADNSAIFLGIFSTDNDVRRLVFFVDNATRNFAMNQVEFLQCFSPAPIPGTLVLLGSGLLGLARIRRRN